MPFLVGHLGVARSGRLVRPLLGAVGAEDACASRDLRGREGAGVLARVGVGGVAVAKVGDGIGVGRSGGMVLVAAAP